MEFTQFPPRSWPYLPRIIVELQVLIKLKFTLNQALTTKTKYPQTYWNYPLYKTLHFQMSLS